MRFLVLNGPNLNLLGLREPEIYGEQTYDDLLALLAAFAKENRITVMCRQSNHEGDLIDWIQQAYGQFDGIVLNAGGYTHTSIAIADAIRAVPVPVVEVHISDISKREEYRRVSFLTPVCVRTVQGMGFAGYTEALRELMRRAPKNC